VLFLQIVSKRVFFLSSLLTGFTSVLRSIYFIARMTGLLSEWNESYVSGIQAYIGVMIYIYIFHKHIRN
jgi:hypothetical protein